MARARTTFDPQLFLTKVGEEKQVCYPLRNT